MKVTSVVVTAARTFNHPHEQYSNLRLSVSMAAKVDEGENQSAVVRELQKQAEGLVEDHKQGLLQSIEELYQLSERQAELRGLEQQLKRPQERLDAIQA